jgi:hypothetical protein
MADIVLLPNVKTEAEGYGVVRALDPKTLDLKWEFKMNDITWAGVLSTAGDVVFSGDAKVTSSLWTLEMETCSGRCLWEAGQQRPDELFRQRPSIHRRRCGDSIVHVCAATVARTIFKYRSETNFFRARIHWMTVWN